MKISEKGLKLICAFEGFSAKPYLCQAGVWTIGYGHTRGVTAHSLPIDEATAQELLRKDVESAERSVGALVNVQLSQGQFDALVSFVFNLGAGRLRASTLLKKVNAHEHDAAAEEFKKWTLAAGKRSKGLIRRRAAERLLYLSPNSHEPQPEFDPAPPPSEMGASSPADTSPSLWKNLLDWMKRN